MKGLHTVDAYSTWGRTRVWYAAVRIAVFLQYSDQGQIQPECTGCTCNPPPCVQVHVHSALNARSTLNGKFIPSKLIGSKKYLPWVTNSIRRDIQNRDNLFKKFKKSRSVESRKKFLRAKHGVKRKIRLSHDNYLEDILGLNNPSDNPEDIGKSDFSRKRLFSLLKNSKRDSQGIGLFNDGHSTVTSNADKANALNRQFQSVFSSRSVLDIVKLCQAALLSAVQSGLDLLIPDSFQCKVPTMPDITSQLAGFSSS